MKPITQSTQCPSIIALSAGFLTSTYATLTQVRSQVEEGNYGRIVAIDVETRAFEIADESLSDAKQLLKRYPEAQIFGIRIGHRAVHRFGFRSPTLSA